MRRCATAGKFYLSFRKEISLLVGGEPLKAIYEV